MKRFVLALSCALAGITPAITEASLTLQIGPERGADAVDAVVATGSAEHFFDLVFNESGPPVNEQLIAYDLGVDAARPGLSLVRAEKPDNWVLPDADAVFGQQEVRPDHVLVNASFALSYSGPLADITSGAKAARVYYSVDPGTAPGLYRITLNPNQTVFGFGDPNCDSCYAVAIDDPGVVLVTPEPAGLALLSVAGAILVCPRPRLRA